jgi:hypothetical protein
VSSPTLDGYGGQGAVAQEVQTSTHPQTDIPFTGLDVGLIAAVGMILVVGALGLRNITRAEGT